MAGAAGVAVHAARGAGDLGPAVLCRAEDAKDGAEIGIDGRDLEAAAGDVADIDFVIEVQGPRVRRADEAALKARGRIDEKLRGHGHVERREQAHELGLVAARVELDFAAAEARDEPGEGIARLSRVVVVRGFVEAVDHSFLGSRRTGRERQSEQDQKRIFHDESEARHHGLR